MTASRRLAAILAADVAGYSRLMGADEEGTAQALRDHRTAADPLIATLRGRASKDERFAYAAPHLMSSTRTPSTAAIAGRASAPCRTSARDQRLCRLGL